MSGMHGNGGCHGEMLRIDLRAVGQRQLAERQRTGLVEYDCINLVKPLHGGTVLHHDASLEQPARRHHLNHRSEEHTSELQSLMRTSYAVFCLKKKKKPDK